MRLNRPRGQSSIAWVGGCPEVEEDRQPGRRGRPLDHEDCRQVLGGVVVPAGAVDAGPSVAADRGQRRVGDWPGSEMRAPSTTAADRDLWAAFRSAGGARAARCPLPAARCPEMININVRFGVRFRASMGGLMLIIFALRGGRAPAG